MKDRKIGLVADVGSMTREQFLVYIGSLGDVSPGEFRRLDDVSKRYWENMRSKKV